MIVIDVKDDRALILSTNSLGINYSGYEGATWENSNLREYLNGDYYSSFQLWEKERILSTNLINSDNPNYGTLGGNNTQDKIFVLSPEEIEKYKELVIQSTGSSINPASGEPNEYFVRMRGKEYKTATYIVHFGSLYINYEGVPGWSGSYASAKPAMWIKLDE